MAETVVKERLVWVSCQWRKKHTVSKRWRHKRDRLAVKYTVFQKNVTLFTFTITSSGVGRFSWVWTWL